MKKKAKTKKKKLVRMPSKKRNKRIVFALNEVEYDALAVYCKRYRIHNRSQFIRENILSKVSQRFVDDYPTLF